MFSRGGLLLLFGFGALSLVALPVAAQQQVGTTHRVTPAAHGSVAGTLAVGSGVHADETIGHRQGGRCWPALSRPVHLGRWAKLQRAAQQVRL
jgi:hypothetical protein